MSTAGAAHALTRLRVALLAVVLLGTLGLIAELVLLEHDETFAQWLPLAVLGAGLLGTIAVVARPGPVSARSTAFRSAVHCSRPASCSAPGIRERSAPR